MRLKFRKGLILDYKDKKNMGNFFESAIHPLTNKQLATLGYHHMSYYDTLYNENYEPFAHIFNKKGILCAFDRNGELFIQNFEECSGVTFSKYGQTTHSNLFYFKKANDYLIFNSDYQVIGESEEVPYTISDHNPEIEGFPFCVIQSSSGTQVYDLIHEKMLKPVFFGKLLSIDSKHEEMIVQVSGKEVAVINYDDKYKSFFDTRVNFTNRKNFYVMGNEALVYFETGSTSYSIVLDACCAYYTVFENYVTASKGDTLDIYEIEETSQGIWSNRKICSVDDGRKLEIYGDDGIISIGYDKKILLSHYLQHKYDMDNYFCDDIVYENGIFKCFQVDNKYNPVTYLCQGQAVNYNLTNEEYHVTISDGINSKIFTPDGKIIFEGAIDDIYKMKDDEDSGKDAMIIQKKGLDKIMGIHYRSKNDEFFNVMTGKTYKPDATLAWHNLINENDFYYDINGKHFLHDVMIQVRFNDYMIVRNGLDYYIYDDNFTSYRVENGTCEYDEFYNNCIVKNDKIAYVVSNSALKSFCYHSIVDGMVVYDSSIWNQFIINGRYVEKDVLRNEIAKGIISKNFSTLI